MQPLPKVRLVSILLAMVATGLTNNVELLIYTWTFIAIPLLILTKQIKKYFYFSLFFLVPFFIILYIIWVLIIQIPPYEKFGTEVLSAQTYVLFITFRFALFTSILQLGVLTIKAKYLASTLYYWGLRKNTLIITLSSLALISELNRRIDEVLTARYARGYFKKRTLWNNFIQLPYMLRSLFTWSLRSAMQRSEIWSKHDTFNKLYTFAKMTTNGTLLGSLLWFSLSLIWFVIVLYLENTSG